MFTSSALLVNQSFDADFFSSHCEYKHTDDHHLGCKPLSVLIILSEDRTTTSANFPVVHGHYYLVCKSVSEAIEATDSFEPDIALIDLRLADWQRLVKVLRQRAEVRAVTLVAISPPQHCDSQTREALAAFRYQIAFPAAACEVEQLLWQVSRDIEVDTNSARDRGVTEKIG